MQTEPVPSRYPGLHAIVDGSEAIAHVETRLSEIACVYPITPTTTMAAIFQAGVAEGLFSTHDVERVNARIETLLGPFDGFFVCPHAPSDGCACRKPSPGLVEEALRKLEVRPEECVLVGDTAADVGAALAAHVRPILVPNHATRRDEVHAAPEVARDLDLAALRALGVVA